jgi:hypothetical protein
MDWEQARKAIEEKIVVGRELNTNRSNNRRVIEVNASCAAVRFGYQGQHCFKVSISATNVIEVPWSVLEGCFSDLSAAGGYTGKTFRRRYPDQAKEHPCHVHVVGQIFVEAGVAVERDNRYVCSDGPEGSSLAGRLWQPS